VKRLHDLDAYLTGELDESAADALEEAMFDAPDDGDLAVFDRLMKLGPQLAAHGTFDMGVTREHLDKLAADGHTVQLLDAGPPGQPRKTLVLSRDAEMIVTRLPLGRTDVARVDIEITILAHQVTKTIKDVFVDPHDGVIYGLCERPLAHLALAAGPTHTKIRRTTGARDVIAEWHLVGQLAI
jgi:hypothetical protein